MRYKNGNVYLFHLSWTRLVFVFILLFLRFPSLNCRSNCFDFATFKKVVGVLQQEDFVLSSLRGVISEELERVQVRIFSGVSPASASNRLLCGLDGRICSEAAATAGVRKNVI